MTKPSYEDRIEGLDCCDCGRVSFWTALHIAEEADEEILKLKDLLDEVICTGAYGGPTLDLVQRINKVLNDK